MVEIELDGKKVEVKEGSMVMHAAEQAGTYIPHFCYHKKLSIAANCRMCLVDVEKMPKAVPACATPVAQGMIVRTKSDKAIKAQKAVMEFLLINHPLDCPICDQGGECQLQDLAVGYGGNGSRYQEEKRVVRAKDVGPLISMAEMSRCIQCTRCVRFGQEIAGQMELGMSHRGEHSEIETFVGATVDSELSGNMIDICPVGALTSKPFRYHARTWELGRRRSVSPHDSTGANLIIQVKNNQVMRVVPFENEAVNECWIADRDRFSYESLNSSERLTSPMIKQGGEWHEVDWQTALEYVANGMKHIQEEHTGRGLGALLSPHSTLEELALATRLLRQMGSDNIDTRLRCADFSDQHGKIRWLGMPIAALNGLDRVLVVGSHLRKDHPLLAQRIRQAARHGAQIMALNEERFDWAMPMHASLEAPAVQWTLALAGIAAAVASERGIQPPVEAEFGLEATDIARALLNGANKAVLLGNAAVHHEQASALHALAQWIAKETGATLGFLGEAANTVGAQLVRAQPVADGLNAAEMLQGKVKGLLLLHTEPEFDSVLGARAAQQLENVDMVVTMSPFKSNMAFSDVLLPVSPFTETSGSFVNTEGRVQGFHAVVKPAGETRPAWKVLRVLGNMLDLSGFDMESSHAVLTSIDGVRDDHEGVVDHLLDNATDATITVNQAQAAPVVASIYQLDGIVRRAPSLQATADARAARQHQGGNA